MLLHVLQNCLETNCQRPSGFHFLVGHEVPRELRLCPVMLAFAVNPGGGAGVLPPRFDAASAATNFLLVAVNSAIVFVSDAMVAAWASSVSDLAMAEAASALT